MSTQVPVTNVFRFVTGEESDFDPSDSSGDEWRPDDDLKGDDEETYIRGRKEVTKKRKLPGAHRDREEPSTSASTSDSDSDVPLASLCRNALAEDDIPLAQLLARDNLDNDEEDLIPLADLMNQQVVNMTAQEMEELAAQMATDPVWTDVPFNPPTDIGFKGVREGAPETGCPNTPYQYFKMMITDSMLDALANQTNIYSMQKTGININTTRKEIETFIGLYLRMGLLQAHYVRLYWALGSRHAPVADFMSRDRFLKLMSTLHFADNLAVDQETKNSDKLWKLRPWLSSFNECLKNIPPEEHHSVDEIMVPFKGKSSIKQYMRGKPHPWGFKLWARAGASGILYDFDVYMGSVDGQRRTPGGLGLGGEVVMKMTRGLERDLNYKVFADNFFSNMPLIQALKAKSICFVGTFRANRFKGLNLKTEKELRKEGRGACDAKVELMSNTVAVRWFDNKAVDTVSTYVGIEPQSEASRYDKKQKQKVTIAQPAIIREYNKFMGGVDLLDSLTSLYKYTLKSRRFYMYIFYHSIAIAVVNSWLWYKRHCVLLNIKPSKLSIFQSHIADALVMYKKTAGRPSICVTSPPPAKIVRQAVPTSDVRLDGVAHLPQWNSARTSCKNRNCKYLSYISCPKCKVHLCFNKDRNCFAEFHLLK